MKFGFRSACTVALIVAAGALAGCSSFREATGANKNSPDEFAVVTKAPLIIPPDYNLQPPRPGAPPTNQISATQSAQNALYNSDPATVASSINGNMSQGEKLLLAYAGAASADSSVRQAIAADNRHMQAADDSFTDELLFWKKSDPATDPNVNADAEAKRISAQQPAPAPTSQTKDNGANNDN
jgi:hypothetical protein